MPYRLFVPILAGATLRDRLVACLGALLGIAICGAVCGWTLGKGYDIPLIVAPMGASAVLLFAVPASPLAQPWPIIGGNTIAAFVGVAVARLVHDPVAATGLAVALAIAAMSFTRSLHPPGGAAALTAALASPSVADAGFMFPLVPVAVNSILLVVLGLLFHKLSRHQYPHVPKPSTNTHGTADRPAELRTGFQPEDIDAALTALDETYDIDRSDLERLFRRVEHEAFVRSNRNLLCRDIMSKDVIVIEQGAPVDRARRLLLEHNIRTLPVVDPDHRLLGTVGLRELATNATEVDAVLSTAITTLPSAPALDLLPTLTDGRTHAVIVTDEDRSIIGIITQTDLLAATARLRIGARSSADGAISYDI